MRHAALLLVSLIACGSASAACSSDDKVASADPNVVSSDIGTNGGQIIVEGATVTIPPGALAASTKITITAQDASAAPAGYIVLSKVFKCEPSGTSFAKPVTMVMPFTDDGLGASSMFWSSGADPAFKDLGGTPANGTMSATVQHFSAGFVGRAK